MFSSFESSNARKISLEGGNQYPGDPGVGKVRGGKGFFFLQAEGGLTLDDTMAPVLVLHFFLINDLPDDIIYNIAIYADDTTLYSKCDQTSDLWQQQGLLLSLNLMY